MPDRSQFVSNPRARFTAPLNLLDMGLPRQSLDGEDSALVRFRERVFPEPPIHLVEKKVTNLRRSPFVLKAPRCERSGDRASKEGECERRYGTAVATCIGCKAIKESRASVPLAVPYRRPHSNHAPV